jgi:DNA polymerase-4
MCPHAVFLPVDYEAYSSASVKFKEVLRTVSPIMEDVGIDEAYLDAQLRHLEGDKSYPTN